MRARSFLKRNVNDFDIFFSFLTNTLFTRRGYLWESHTLPNALFVSSHPSLGVRNFLIKSFSSGAFLSSLFWNFVSSNNISSTGFFAELELIGLGFRIRKITSRVYRFFWGHANYVYLFAPLTALIEYAHDERMIFIFSSHATVVNDITSYLMLLKRLSVYRVAGFVRPGKIIRLNSGKQR